MIELVPHPKLRTRKVMGMTMLHFEVKESKVIKRVIVIKEKEMKKGDTFSGLYNNKNRFKIEYDGVSITSSIKRADDMLAGLADAGAIKLLSNKGL